eukprot:3784190-Pyramimonas_sp.AAC.1
MQIEMHIEKQVDMHSDKPNANPNRQAHRHPVLYAVPRASGNATISEHQGSQYERWRNRLLR